MAVQNPFFGKRDSDTLQPRQPGSVLGSGSSLSGSSNSAASASSSSTGLGSVVNKSASSATGEPAGSKLTVGPNIKLKGVEITDCDTLVVEGTVEATMNSRVIQIAAEGAFRGSAEIDIAEIHGEFEGNLTVREKLVIFGSGRVHGKIRYGKVIIEEGGQLTGEIECSNSTRKSGLSSAFSSAVAKVEKTIETAL